MRRIIHSVFAIFAISTQQGCKSDNPKTTPEVEHKLEPGIFLYDFSVNGEHFIFLNDEPVGFTNGRGDVFGFGVQYPFRAPRNELRLEFNQYDESGRNDNKFYLGYVDHTGTQKESHRILNQPEFKIVLPDFEFITENVWENAALTAKDKVRMKEVTIEIIEAIETGDDKAIAKLLRVNSGQIPWIASDISTLAKKEGEILGVRSVDDLELVAGKTCALVVAKRVSNKRRGSLLEVRLKRGEPTSEFIPTGFTLTSILFAVGADQKIRLYSRRGGWLLLRSIN